MKADTKTQEGEQEATLLSGDELRRLQQRSDGRGLVRLLVHLAAICLTGSCYLFTLAAPGSSRTLVALCCVGFGFTLVTMFAAMHESVHRTAFRTLWLNNGVGWFAGLLAFYNSTFYRHYHGWHHRFTQIPGRDPELEDPKPTDLRTYLWELTGLPWWRGKIRTFVALARGRLGGYGFLNDRTGPQVVRSARLQLLVYGVGIAVSLAAGRPWFVTLWLLPVIAAQPLLRAILLAEHTGCSEDDNALSNTRTTHTVFPVRLLMWEMPYHAEHHRYPALPFFALAPAHDVVGPSLVHVARRGYLGFHVALIKSFGNTTGTLRGAP
jgi:fatty acid desaturase